MKTGFIGAGKVGVSLGKYFTEHGFIISGYYSRNPESAKEAAVFTGTEYFHQMEDIIRESDLLFLTVPDGSVYEVYSGMLPFNIEGKCLCHCSGALSSRVFSDIRERGAYGYSIHPICAVSDKYHGYRDLSNAYFTMEGDGRYLEKLKLMMEGLGNPIEVITPEVKARYHMAAVFASNLVEGLYHQATEMMVSCGLSPDFAKGALASLFLGNAEKIAKYGVESALTGPVERGDVSTIEKHLKASDGDGKEIYRLLSKQLVEIAKRKNPDRDYKGVMDVLENSECQRYL